MKELKNIKESRILNSLIPKLIDQNKQMGQEMKKRMQLNRVFSEFENKASNGLNYYINESSQRYINLKNGHNLKNLLVNSRQRNKDQANKILQDPFYIDLNLEKEKEKMKINKIKDYNRNVQPLLFKMKQPESVNINNISHEDNEHTSNYNEYMNNITNRNNLGSYSSRKRKVTFITQKSNKKLNPIQYNKELNAAIMDKDIKSLSKLFKNEENLINKSFDNYKDNIINNIDKYSNSRKERSNMKIKLPKLKLLNYRYDKNLNKNDDKGNNKNEVNYKYLISFSEKNIINRKNKYNTPEKNNDFKYENKFPLITEINNYNYKFTNYGNTSDMVINSAKKEMNLESDMNEKLNELDKLLGNEQTPKIHLYDEILNKKSLTIKNERRERAKKIIENQKHLGGSIKDRLNMRIDNNVSLLDRVMRNINKYNEKKH